MRRSQPALPFADLDGFTGLDGFAELDDVGGLDEPPPFEALVLVDDLDGFADAGFWEPVDLEAAVFLAPVALEPAPVALAGAFLPVEEVPSDLDLPAMMMVRCARVLMNKKNKHDTEHESSRL